MPYYTFRIALMRLVLYGQPGPFQLNGTAVDFSLPSKVDGTLSQALTTMLLQVLSFRTSKSGMTFTRSSL